MNADGSGQRKLTRSPAVDAPGLVARRAEDRLRAARRQLEIYVMNADGSGQRNLTRNPRPASAPAGRPTGGSRLRRDGGDLRHERRRQRAAESDAEPGERRRSRLWSPDGRTIAFASTRDGTSRSTS